MSNLTDFLEQLGDEADGDYEPYPCPCTGCPEFESYVSPATPDGPEEYDTFCGAVEEGLLSDDIFLRFMEMQHERDEKCPYQELKKRLDAADSLAAAVEAYEPFRIEHEFSSANAIKAALVAYREQCPKKEES